MNTFAYTEINKAGTAGDNPTIDEITIKWDDDGLDNVSHLDKEPGEEYYEEDQERLRAYQNGDWIMQGVRAIVQVSYPINSKGDRRLETFTSGGLWGIESDSDDDYKREEEIGQLRDLKEHLEAFGVDTAGFWQKAGVDAAEQAWYQERVNACVKPAPVLEW